MSNNKDTLIHQFEHEIEMLQKKLAASNNAFLNIIGKNRDGILILDESGRIIYSNPAALDLFGKNLGSLLGENIGVFFDTKNKTEITIIHKDRGSVIIEFNIADTVWDNKPAKLASLRDVTEHKKSENILKRLSHYDYLTDLSNRVFFEETLRRALARADRMQKKVGLFFLDMDGFKQVNDNYGHQIGDKLLVHTASILKSCVRMEDVVSRLGGDEFAIIIERVERTLDYTRIATEILMNIKKPIFIDQKEISVNFSIGIAIYPDDANNLDDLIKNADTAMYRSKSLGRGQYHYFNEVKN